VKRLLVSFVFIFVFSIVFAASASAQCTKIKDNLLFDSFSNQLVLGFDQFGYNYQARMFNGTYASSDRNNNNGYYGDTTSDYIDDKLIMKWSDDWLSNLDCNHDGKLDRGGAGGTESKGWLTNLVEGDYISGGESYHYTYFAKIVYVGPAQISDSWAATRIWGTFAIIEEVYNDPFGGYHGVDKTKLGNPAGLGVNTN
jgi:hypothetical protein